MMLPICGNHYTDGITLQCHFSCQLKKILKKSAQDVPHYVGRVLRENFLYNSTPSVQAKTDCCGLMISSHKEVNV